LTSRATIISFSIWTLFHAVTYLACFDSELVLKIGLRQIPRTGDRLILILLSTQDRNITHRKAGIHSDPIQSVVFWVLTPCSYVVGYQSFGGPSCLLRHVIITVNTSNLTSRIQDSVSLNTAWKFAFPWS